MNKQRLKECRYYRGEEKIKRFPYVPRLFATPEMAYVQGEGTRVEEYALMKLKDVGITQTVADIPIELLAHLFVSHCALANRNKHSLGIISLTPKQMVDSFMNKYIPEYLNIAPSDRGQLIIW